MSAYARYNVLHIIAPDGRKYPFEFGDDILMFRCQFDPFGAGDLCVAVITSDNSVTVLELNDTIELNHSSKYDCPSRPLYITDHLVNDDDRYMFAIFCENQMMFIKGRQDSLIENYVDSGAARVVKVIPSIAKGYSVCLTLVDDQNSRELSIDVMLNKLGEYIITNRRIPSRLLDYDPHRSRLFEDGTLEISAYDVGTDRYRELLISSGDYGEDDIVPSYDEEIGAYLNYYDLPERMIFRDVAKVQFGNMNKPIMLFKDGSLFSGALERIADDVTNFQIIDEHMIHFIHSNGTVKSYDYHNVEVVTQIDPVGVKFPTVSSYDLPMRGIRRVKSARK